MTEIIKLIQKFEILLLNWRLQRFICFELLFHKLFSLILLLQVVIGITKRIFIINFLFVFGAKTLFRFLWLHNNKKIKKKITLQVT